jgi:hypothetical protein
MDGKLFLLLLLLLFYLQLKSPVVSEDISFAIRFSSFCTFILIDMLLISMV